MGRILILAAVAVLAVVVAQAMVQADGVVVVTNPAGGSVNTAQLGEGGQPQKLAPGASVYGAYVPAVPTPPGVIGQYGPLPCTYAYTERAGGLNVEYLVRELGERE